jgi:hypothetical protein
MVLVHKEEKHIKNKLKKQNKNMLFEIVVTFARKTPSILFLTKAFKLGYARIQHT